MFRNSQAPTVARGLLNLICAAYKTTATGPLAPTLAVHLFDSGGLSLNPDTTLAALTAVESAFSGYAMQSLTLSGPVEFSPLAQGMLGNVTFTATTASPFVTGNATGYWVDDGTNLVLAEQFGPGFNVPFGLVGAFLDLSVVLPAISY
jgi:hypothetical protein